MTTKSNGPYSRPIIALQAIDKKEIGRRPHRGRNCALRPAGQNDLEDFLFGGEFIKEHAAGGRRVRLKKGELAQRVVNDLARGSERRAKTIGAKLQHGIDLAEVPGDAGSHRNSALESLRVFRLGERAQIGARRPEK